METIGIDLGTTNSVAARNASVLWLEHQDHTSSYLPSVVAFPPNGSIEVGDSARRRRALDPVNTIYSAKRIIGELWDSERVQEYRGNYPFELIPQPDGGVALRTRAGDYTPEKISAALVSALCLRAKQVPNQLSAVVSVPASFGPAQRDATLRAVRSCGFARVSTIDEPVATALAYLNRTSVRYGAVYDLGGGTFDFALLECRRDPFRVIAHGGDAYLGGDDVDRALADWVAEQTRAQHALDLRADPRTFARLVLACEEAKVGLSERDRVEVDPRRADPGAPPAVTPVPIERAQLRALTEDLIRRTFVLCDRVLGEAGIQASQVEAVFLAGGATCMPGVRDAVGRYFGTRPRRDIDPMHVVAIGASMAAARPALARLLAG